MLQDTEKKWYFNTHTNQVEHGRISSLLDVVGPYDTREEAEHALDDVRNHNEAWVKQSAEWSNSEEEGYGEEPEDKDNTEGSWPSWKEWVNDPNVQYREPGVGSQDVPSAIF
ncbi:MAG: hypothetical protein IIT36_04600 [Aeriscardovia sp.]|nr:hypothetical protein [Aeriscardovia sp.]